MNKDVIYIDVEDDITAIIGKVKDTKEKIVALVPPKRTGILQSAVNLRLLARAASQGNKRLVLITSNSALTALASAAKIPVAKNLQSKPEIAEISALDVDNGEDVIDGSSLPVGEHARTAPGTASSLGSLAISDSTIEDAAEEVQRAAPPTPGTTPGKPRIRSGIKVPNFSSFRKKLIFGIGGGVLLIVLLVWAFVFAPQAKVIITARTTDSSANAKVTLDPGVATSLTSSTIKSSVEQLKKDVSVEFDATGTKDVGEKSQGQVVFKNCEDEDNPVTIPAGTAVSVNGRNYLTQATVSVPKANISFTCTSAGTSNPVAIVAQEIGEAYNTPNGTNFSVAGHSNSPSGPHLYATATTDITGGSKRQVKVVSSSDVQKAADQLAAQNSDDAKKQLKSQFDNTFMVLDQTFKADKGTPQSTPAVDQEVAAGAKAKLTTSVTYNLAAVTKTDVSKFLDDYFKKQLEDTKDQRVYDNGNAKANFSNVAAGSSGFTANLVATAKIGPKIDDAAIKNLAKGKRFGDIQSAIETIQGVDDVDVKFSPFWVNTAPNDVNRIKVEFNLNGGQ